MAMPAVTIVGAGQGGFQVAASLREEGFAGRIVIVGDEPALPYQRPPLSKSYLAGHSGREELWLRPEAFYERHEIEVLTGERVAAIDRRGVDAARAAGLDVAAWTVRRRPTFDRLARLGVVAVCVEGRALDSRD